MSLQLPKRAASLAAVGVGVLVLGGCSSETQGEWERFAMPDPASVQGERILELWQGAWIAALITGVIVWGLIFYAIWRFRRRSEDEIPIQTRYNLPLEIFYTIAPIIMVIVFFAHTVEDPELRPRRGQPGRRRQHHRGHRPAVVVDVQLRHRRAGPLRPTTTSATTSSPTSRTSTTAGTGSHIPDLLPAGRTRRPGSTCTRPT